MEQSLSENELRFINRNNRNNQENQTMLGYKPVNPYGNSPYGNFDPNNADLAKQFGTTQDFGRTTVGSMNNTLQGGFNNNYQMQGGNQGGNEGNANRIEYSRMLRLEKEEEMMNKNKLDQKFTNFHKMLKKSSNHPSGNDQMNLYQYE